MVNQGVIKLVIEPKSQICLDLKDLNRIHQPLKTSLACSKKLSILGASHGYWFVVLDEESSYLQLPLIAHLADSGLLSFAWGSVLDKIFFNRGWASSSISALEKLVLSMTLQSMALLDAGCMATWACL